MFREQHDAPSFALPFTPIKLSDAIYDFVGDEAFKLTSNVMKPFLGLHNKRTKQRIFNFRLSRSPRVSKNAFSIMSYSFRVFRKPSLLEPDTATKVTLVAVYLHNYLRRSKSRNVYSSVGMLDRKSSESGEVFPGLWRQDPATCQINKLPAIPRRSFIEDQKIRDKFADYNFVSPQGELHFQYSIFF